MAKKAEKACLECGEEIKGRADKKFCSDQCRVTYNNKLNSDNTNYVRSVNSTLRKNRRILMELNPQGKRKISRDKVAQAGFNFTYHTDIYKTKEGALYFYCYEQGYLMIDDKTMLLVAKQEK